MNCSMSTNTPARPWGSIRNRCLDASATRSSREDIALSLCTNKFLTEDKFYEWEFDNPVLKQTFMIKNRKINWNGHKARIELSHDAVSPEYKLAKKDRERDAIIRTIPGGFARVDARDMSTILWYGGGFLEMIGYSGEQFEKELYSQCTYVHPDDLERTVDVMENALKTGEDTVAEARIITRSGAVKYLTMTFSYVSGKDSWDGIPSFLQCGSGRDQTEGRAGETATGAGGGISVCTGCQCGKDQFSVLHVPRHPHTHECHYGNDGHC